MTSPQCKLFLAKAKNNERFVEHLRGNCKDKAFFDWAFVGLFYSALHYFNAFLVYKKITIPTSHKDNYNYEGRITLAKNKFYTNKNGILDSVGFEFEQLFNWSCDSRYKGTVTDLLGEAEFEAAVKALEAVKLVTFNEIGYRPKKGQGESIKTVKLSTEYLETLKTMRGL